MLLNYLLFCTLLNPFIWAEPSGGSRAEFSLAKARKNSCPAFHRRIAFATVAVCSRVWFFHCHSLQPALAGNLILPLILRSEPFFKSSTRTVLFFYMVIYWQPFPLTTKTMNKRESFSPSLLSTNWGGHPHQVLSVLCPGTAQWPSKKRRQGKLAPSPLVIFAQMNQ